MRSLLTLLPVLVLATSALAFEEVPVSRLELVEAIGFQRAPAVAGDGGTNFFAVWTDDREGAPMVYGARIDARQFEVTDRVGVRLLDGGGRPAVAFGGMRYLVVDSFLQYALIGLDGKVLARGQIDGEPTGKPSVLYNGRDFLVFYGHDAVHAATIDVDGRLVAEPVTIVPAAGVETQVHDAARHFQRERMVLLYSRGDELSGAVLSTAGAPLETVRLGDGVPTSSRGAPQATVAAVTSLSGTGFLVAWHRDFSDVVMALRLDVDGHPLGGETRAATLASTPELIEHDGDFHLYTVEPGGVRLRRVVVTSGIFVDFPSTMVVASSPVSVVVARGRTDLGIAELDQGSQPTGSRLETFGAPQTTLSLAGRAELRPAITSGRDGEMVISAGRRDEDPPAIAVVGGTYAVVRGGAGVSLQLVRGGGPVGLPVTLDPNGQWPAIAASGGDFIAAWTHSSEVRFARVSTAGVVLATGAVTNPSPSPPIPGLACDAGECILAWHEATIRQTCPRFACVVVDERVKAIRFDDDLVVRDTLVLTPEPSLHRGRVVAAAHDGRYAAAWQDGIDVRAVTVDRTGAVESSTRVPGANPAVARQNDSWLLVREVGEQLVGRWLPSGFERVLTPADGQARRSPSLFSLGDRVLMVYERTTRNEAAGGVPRAYVTVVDPPPPRRRAASFR